MLGGSWQKDTEDLYLKLEAEREEKRKEYSLKYAEDAKQCYDELIKVGFTDEQAMKLVIVYIQSKYNRYGIGIEPGRVIPY